jgi:hypothetical protein
VGRSWVIKVIRSGSQGGGERTVYQVFSYVIAV